MIAAAPDQSYVPQDQLYLWYLGKPSHPRYVGELNLVHSLRGVSLRYNKHWLQAGFALSEDLPLIDIELLPKSKETAAGSVDDARPDRWGERVIRLLERPARQSLLEMLYFAGHDRFGALGVSTSATVYTPRTKTVLPQLADVPAIHELVQRVIVGDQIEEVNRRLIAPGATMGGARPKALIEIEGHEWVLKFADQNMPFEPVVEHASMTLAAKAGINVAETRTINFGRGVAVAIKRFDRMDTRRLHTLSANVALKAAQSELSYPALAQLLRRRGDLRDGLNQTQMRELFRRLVFNILIDNTDDHEKNHALIMTDQQTYLLSPAYDVLPSGDALGYQAMIVGNEGETSTIQNALSMFSSYGLTRQQALNEAKTLAHVVSGWREHFKVCGVSGNVIEMLARQIDGEFLREQRDFLVEKP
jgi:serine/threonine-protein kinase HipA